MQPYADVWIDGELKAESTTFYEVDLNTGSYAIELRHPSYQTYSRTVDVISGETERVIYDFASG